MTTHLKCLYWNIHGISSRVIGDKNKDTTFLDITCKFDVICLSELHTDKDISIPGFTVKKQKFRPKTHKGPKIGGGIAVYVKQNVSKNFQLIPNNNVAPFGSKQPQEMKTTLYTSASSTAAQRTTTQHSSTRSMVKSKD